MAVCGNCGATTSRVRTTYHEDRKSKQVTTEEECPNCKPGSFEPRYLQERPATAWEAYPEQFRKKFLPDGRVGYFATEERQSDQEARMQRRPKDEVEKYNKAVEEKRRHRRTQAMTQQEIDSTVIKCRERLEPAEAKKKREYDEAMKRMSASELVV